MTCIDDVDLDEYKCLKNMDIDETASFMLEKIHHDETRWAIYNVVKTLYDLEHDIMDIFRSAFRIKMSNPLRYNDVMTMVTVEEIKFDDNGDRI